MNRSTLVLVAALAISCSVGLRAQCTPLPGTGCPGELAPQCNGSPSIGKVLQIVCISSGRANVRYLALGLCAPSAVALTPPLTCVPGPCGLAVDLQAAVVLDTQMNPVNVPIPMDPSLIGARFCTQCIDLIVARPCITLSEAVRIDIMP